jgi:hypothetical protein
VVDLNIKEKQKVNADEYARYFGNRCGASKSGQMQKVDDEEEEIEAEEADAPDEAGPSTLKRQQPDPEVNKEPNAKRMRKPSEKVKDNAVADPKRQLSAATRKVSQEHNELVGTHLHIPRSAWPEWVPGPSEMDVPFYRARVTERIRKGGKYTFETFSNDPTQYDLEKCGEIEVKDIKSWSANVHDILSPVDHAAWLTKNRGKSFDKWSGR